MKRGEGLHFQTKLGTRRITQMSSIFPLLGILHCSRFADAEQKFCQYCATAVIFTFHHPLDPPFDLSKKVCFASASLRNNAKSFDRLCSYFHLPQSFSNHKVHRTTVGFCILTSKSCKPQFTMKLSKLILQKPCTTLPCINILSEPFYLTVSQRSLMYTFLGVFGGVISAPASKTITTSLKRLV